jgi:hypothetical protein
MPCAAVIVQRYLENAPISSVADPDSSDMIISTGCTAGNLAVNGHVGGALCAIRLDY